MAASVSAMEAVGPDEAIPTMTASFRPIALARSRLPADPCAVVTAAGLAGPGLTSAMVADLPVEVVRVAQAPATKIIRFCARRGWGPFGQLQRDPVRVQH